MRFLAKLRKVRNEKLKYDSFVPDLSCRRMRHRKVFENNVVSDFERQSNKGQIVQEPACRQTGATQRCLIEF